MKYLIGLIVLITACTPPREETSKEDAEVINQIRNTYVEGWLAGDSETVLSIFYEDATIIPSGMAPIKGIDKIEEYWFPNDSSITTIHSYEIELIEVKQVDSMAFAVEKGVLNFTYEKGDFSVTKTSTSHATTVFLKRENEGWKIISRMWTQLQ